MFARIQTSVADMVHMFKESKFYLCVAQKQNYKDGITFTENNIVQYLAEIEEYISSLITYTAFKNEKDDAAITYIPLENLQPKDWKKSKDHLKLEKNEQPIGVEVVNTDEQQDPPEFEVIRGRDLFKRFNEHMESSNIIQQFDERKRGGQQVDKDEDEMD